jgi:hypothetical protein
MKCEKCNSKLIPKEFWGDTNGELKHIEYYVCPECPSFADANGKMLGKVADSLNEDDLQRWAKGGHSDTSIGI